MTDPATGPTNPANLRLVEHPLIQHKLTIMRKKETSAAQFRRLLREISLLLGYEATKDVVTTSMRIETPLMAMQAPVLAGKKMCFFSILRAGDGLLQGMLELVPSARVGHVGLYRDPKTLKAVEYYFKAPHSLDERLCVALDPMLATGHSAVAAISRIKEAGANRIRFICLLAAPEGIDELSRNHPDVEIFTPAVDKKLNHKGYILPGLGDAGDRLFGTK